MNIKQYQFFCTHCSYKKVIESNEITEFTQVKLHDIERGSPFLDPVTKKVVTPEPIKRRKTFKCPNCGHLIKPKEFKTSEKKADEQTNWINGRETGASGPQIP